MKSGVFCQQLTRSPRGGLVADKDRNAMPADAVKQLGNRLVVQVGQVCSIERCIFWQTFRQVEAEWYFALKPRLHCVSIGRNHLGWHARRKCGDVLIEDLGNQRRLLG